MIRIYNLFLLTQDIILDYYKYNNSLSGLYGLLYQIYIGALEVYEFDDMYMIVRRLGKTANIVFASNKGKWFTILKLIKNKDELMDKYDIDTIIFSMEKIDLNKHEKISRIFDDSMFVYKMYRSK